jgi:hypothetical protein
MSARSLAIPEQPIFKSKRFPVVDNMRVLVQVALGNMNELLDADYRANELPPGKMSTKGIGKTAPDPAQDVMLPNGVKVPLGTPKDVVGRVSLGARVLWFLPNVLILVGSLSDVVLVSPVAL